MVKAVFRAHTQWPAGEMNVPEPIGDDAWAECLRDLKRTLSGGGIFVVGSGRRIPVQDTAKDCGDVSQQACELAFADLSRTIGLELQAQASSEQEPSALRELTRRVAAYVSVAPGMQAVMKHSMPPALWQPTCAICIGQGQVRVLTLAFVGDPVKGDRPSCKCTPFVLRLLSGDLADAKPALARYCVRPALEGVDTIAENLVGLQNELFLAMESGKWTSISDSHGGCQSVAEHPASPPVGRWRFLRNRGAANQQVQNSPKTPGRTSGGTGQPRQVGDRASRMRAAIERTQGRKAAEVLQRPAEQANMADSISPRGGSATPVGSVTPPGSATPRTPAPPGSTTPRTAAPLFGSAASPTDGSRAASPECTSEDTWTEPRSWALTSSLEGKPAEQVQTAQAAVLESADKCGSDAEPPVPDPASAEPSLPETSHVHADDAPVDASTEVVATKADDSTASDGKALKASSTDTVPATSSTVESSSTVATTADANIPQRITCSMLP